MRLLFINPNTSADLTEQGARVARKAARPETEIVPATVSDEADIAAWAPQSDITIRLVRAIAAGVAASPGLNAWYDGRTMERRLLKQIDLGLAVDTEDGLFVPVLRNVAARDAADLRRGIEEYKKVAARG